MLRNRKYLSSKLQAPSSKLLACGLQLAACSVFFLWACSFAQQEYVYDAKGKRDPFIPLVSRDGVLVKLDKEESKSLLTIEGIIYDKQGSSYALVGGNVARVGDPVGDGYRVLKIEQNKVIFIKEGQPVEVIFREDENEK